MHSNDELFLKEFNSVVSSLSARGMVGLHDIAVPDELKSKEIDFRLEQVTFRGIEEEYYSSLNNTTAYLLSRPKLERKKFNNSGEYVKDKDGKFFTEYITVPQYCVAVLSRVKIGVPLKWKSVQEGYIYVDLYKDNEDTYFIYILPREVCYKLNLVSLSISLDRPHNFYGACQVFLKTGQKLYVSISDYKPSRVANNKRIIMVKHSLDLTNEYKKLLTFWSESGIIFNIEMLWLAEVINGKQNAGYTVLESTLDEYVQYDEETPMSVTTSSCEELDSLFGNTSKE